MYAANSAPLGNVDIFSATELSSEIDLLMRFCSVGQGQVQCSEGRGGGGD